MLSVRQAAESSMTDWLSRQAKPVARRGPLKEEEQRGRRSEAEGKGRKAGRKDTGSGRRRRGPEFGDDPARGGPAVLQ